MQVQFQEASDALGGDVVIDQQAIIMVGKPSDSSDGVEGGRRGDVTGRIAKPRIPAMRLEELRPIRPLRVSVLQEAPFLEGHSLGGLQLWIETLVLPQEAQYVDSREAGGWGGLVTGVKPT